MRRSWFGSVAAAAVLVTASGFMAYAQGRVSHHSDTNSAPARQATPEVTVKAQGAMNVFHSQRRTSPVVKALHTPSRLRHPSPLQTRNVHVDRQTDSATAFPSNTPTPTPALVAPDCGAWDITGYSASDVECIADGELLIGARSEHRLVAGTYKIFWLADVPSEGLVDFGSENLLYNLEGDGHVGREYVDISVQRDLTGAIHINVVRTGKFVSGMLL